MKFHNFKNLLWVEKWRPKRVSDIIMLERHKSTFLKWIEKGEIPNLLLYGPPGCGKTTVAKAVAKQLEMNHLFINASEQRGIDVLRYKVNQFASTASMNGKMKIVIFDESDNMTDAMFKALRSSIEGYAGGCRFIFTANFKYKIPDFLHSRLQQVSFEWNKEEKKELLKQFAKRLFQILKKEEVSFVNKEAMSALKKFIITKFPDMRFIINEVQKHSQIDSRINEDIIDSIGDVDFSSLYDYLKRKEWNKMREFVRNSRISDAKLVYNQIFKDLEDLLSGENMAEAVLILEEYLYRSCFEYDKEINLTAFFTALMANCKFK